MGSVGKQRGDHFGGQYRLGCVAKATSHNKQTNQSTNHLTLFVEHMTQESINFVGGAFAGDDELMSSCIDICTYVCIYVFVSLWPVLHTWLC